MKESRRANVYKRGGFLFIRSSSQTDVGLWLERGPCIKLACDSSPAEIGRATRDALARSGAIIPHPTEWKSVDEDNPILEMAGIKRWSTFRRGTRNVGIWAQNGKLELTTTENEGSDGFAHLEERMLSVPPDATAAELGAAINGALERCK